ncbi:uncharacterized protein LOC100897896 [Galendromus occidentalis]|uniref:Uncharacterized protein LOC100897896 n=1 Tax=Galendromus occidentalis TaxID=34638 RepID=A0AAJ6QWB7_9ACAR|nr:uncharacterized protein LOC100897896 [Galendromus occidentalis]
MFLFAAFSLIFLSVTCSASSNQAKIDAYIDAIVDDAYKQIVDAKLERYPLQTSSFKIASTGISNRDVKVNVTRGHFEALRSIGRRTPCNVTLPQAFKGRKDLAPPSNITISCNVTLAGVRAVVLNGTFKGDTLSGSAKNFSTSTIVETANMNVTFVGRPGLKGHLSLTVLRRIVLSTSFQNPKQKPDLNKERFMHFIEELNKKLATQLFTFAEGPYKKYLNIATARKVLPYLV